MIGCVECTVCVYRSDAPVLGGAGVVGLGCGRIAKGGAVAWRIDWIGYDRLDRLGLDSR